MGRLVRFNLLVLKVCGWWPDSVPIQSVIVEVVWLVPRQCVSSVFGHRLSWRRDLSCPGYGSGYGGTGDGSVRRDAWKAPVRAVRQHPPGEHQAATDHRTAATMLPLRTVRHL